MLISKFPTFSFKKISIKPKLTIFILFGLVISFISLMFFTFETLLVFSLGYLITIPIASYVYSRSKKKQISQTSYEDHEDIL